MPSHAATASRRVTHGNVVGAVAILTVTAAVLVTALTSHNPVSAAAPLGTATIAHGSANPTPSSAEPQTPSAATSVAPTTSSAAVAAQIALLETSAAQPAAEQSAAAPVAATTAAAAVVAPAQQAAAAVPPASPTPEPAKLSAEALITGRTMYVTESVNVREAPGTAGTSVLATLGARDQVTAGDSVDNWVPVHTGNVFGWVNASYLADGTAPEPAPAAPAPAAAAPAAASSGNWMEALIPEVDPGGEANWVFERKGGWGASDGHTNYIDPNVPSDKRFSVMVHELGHVKQVEVYGSLTASVAAMSAITGAASSNVSANEKTADCIALMLGASWINYGCPDSLRGAASAVLAGRRA